MNYNEWRKGINSKFLDAIEIIYWTVYTIIGVIKEKKQ